MAGRKRKIVAREPNGQPDRKLAESRHSPSAIKRMVDSAVLKASDPRLGTELGRLLLAGDITSKQAGAGWQWAELAHEAIQALGATPLQPKAQTFERGSKGQAPDIDGAVGARIAERDARLVRRYERARLILDAYGVAGNQLTRRLCEGRGQMLRSYEELVAVRRCLDALAAHFAVA